MIAKCETDFISIKGNNSDLLSSSVLEFSVILLLTYQKTMYIYLTELQTRKLTCDK